MADRFPLIANSSSNQIQELAVSDNLNLDGNSIVGVVSITASGNVSIGGTLTYEDVSNVDSVGLITARTGINVVGGGISVTSGNIEVTGIVTATTLKSNIFQSKGQLKERVNITAGKLSDNVDINIDKGNVHLFTTQETTTSTPNIVSNAGINTNLEIGETISVTIITTAAAGAYSASLNIDGASKTIFWTGGNTPTDGGSSNVDITAYSITKTAGSTYTIIANRTKTS